MSADVALLLGLVFAGSSMDNNISDYLTSKYPLSGSAETARNISDWGKHSLKASMLISGLIYDPVAVPFQELGSRATSRIVSHVKHTSLRTRPDGSDRLSFPSGHATGASYRAHSTIQNLNGRYPHLETAIQAVAIGTAYFRVESGRHYPSDVLIGYALGKYMSDAVGNGVTFLFDRDQVSISKAWRF